MVAQPDGRYDALDAQIVEREHSDRDGNDEVCATPTGEERRIAAAGLEDILVWVSPGNRGQLVDGKLVSVTRPPSVVATVVGCGPHIKGKSSGRKDATLDNGLKRKTGTMVDVGHRAESDSDTLEVRNRVR